MLLHHTHVLKYLEVIQWFRGWQKQSEVKWENVNTGRWRAYKRSQLTKRIEMHSAEISSACQQWCPERWHNYTSDRIPSKRSPDDEKVWLSYFLNNSKKLKISQYESVHSPPASEWRLYMRTNRLKSALSLIILSGGEKPWMCKLGLNLSYSMQFAHSYLYKIWVLNPLFPRYFSLSNTLSSFFFWVGKHFRKDASKYFLFPLS